jgi:hypothetical protein
MRWALAIAGLSLLAGCLKDNTIVENFTRTADVRFDPFDGATAQSGRDLMIHVEEAGLVVDDAMLADLGARLRVRTWPGGAPIAITTQTGTGSFPTDKVVRVTPDATLEDRWHVLLLDSLPKGFFPRTKLDDGTVGARFRPGSHPRVAKVDLCGKDVLGMKVLLTFSEPVQPPPGAVVSFAISGHATDCDLNDSRSDGMNFFCGELGAKASLTLSLGSGIVAASGVALEPGTWDIAIASLLSGSCQTFTPAI